MKTFQLSLPDELARDLQTAATTGEFAGEHEVMLAALRQFLASRAMNPPPPAYRRLAELLEQAWHTTRPNNPSPALTLPALIAAMRQSHHTEHPATSLYFAGADADHPYFLQNEALGVGIAVLPEDAEKAKVRKRHPHQVEVMFVLEGAMQLHIEGKDPVTLQKGDHYVIGKNVCHWVTPVEDRPSAFVFVKTDPAIQPRGVLCGSD